METTKKSTFKVLFYLKKNAPKKNGKVTVMCRITVNDKIFVAEKRHLGGLIKLNLHPKTVFYYIKIQYIAAFTTFILKRCKLFIIN
jgi:hypothetical protein